MINSLIKNRLKFFYVFAALFFSFPLAAESFAAGVLDSSFGSGGVATSDLGSDASVHGLLAQSDGKLVVAAKNNGKYVLLRYNSNGTLDANFGVGGKIITSYDSANAKVSFNILANGLFAVGNNSSVVRYDEAGNAVSTAVFPEGELAAFRPDGKIVTAAVIANPVTYICPQAKVLSTKTFNADGSPTGSSQIACGTGTGGVQSVVALVPNPDNSVYVGALNTSSNTSTALVCLMSEASSRCNFSLSGRVGYNLINLASQRDGRYISLSNFDIVRDNLTNQPPPQLYDLTGSAQKPFARVHGNRRVAALRGNESMLVLNEDFTLSGIASINSYFAGATEQASVFVQADEKIIVAGQFAAPDGRKNIRLIRFAGVLNSAAPGFDFDADNKSDLTVFRQSNAVWYSQRSAAGFAAAQFGLPTDTPVAADYDGDGKFDYAVFRPSEGNWYILMSSNNQLRAVHFGQTGDRPLPADYDGDGRADLAIFRDGVWYFLDSSNNQLRVISFGLATDKTVPADYDGDGRADIAVYRDGVWFWLRSSDNAFRSVQFGVATDNPVVGDYDGDGQADQAVYRGGVWYLNRSRLGFAAVNFGVATDVPVPSDYDGDGKTDIAVYRGGVWFLQRSAQGNSFVQFGLPDDLPMTANN